MTRLSKGNLLQAPAEALVNTVNTEGVMGKGIGLQFKQAYPEMFRAYTDACKAGRVRLGQMEVFDLGGLVDGTRWINMTIGRASLIALMDRYLRGLLDPFVSLLELHKLMYFMQEAGQDLRLKYEPGRYGPYAGNLRQVLIKLEGHFVQGYGDGADSPSKPIELLDGSVAEATQFLADNLAVQERMNRVAALIDGFEDPYGMELLSSVHCVMCRDIAARDSADAAVTAVHEWNERKQQSLKAEHLQIAWHRLKKMGWDSETRSAIH